MTVAVVALWSPGCPHRERNWDWLKAKLEAAHPDWPIVVGEHHGKLYSRTQAMLDGARKTDADVLVFTDADVWTDGLPAAVDHVGDTGWSVPHRLIHRLSADSTEQVLAGHDWRGLPLSTDNAQDARPYRGHEGGTLLVVTRGAFQIAPPDPRFVGWGSEDDALALALRTLVGEPWRGTDDLVHLWHPPQERRSRVVGTSGNKKLLERYRRAARDPRQMLDLMDEWRCAA